MRNKIFTGLFLILLCGIVNAFSQDGSFTFTTSAANINGSRAMIDNPALNDNPDAVIIVTQSGGPNHYAGVWYLSGKWYVVNRDQQPMAAGTNFQINFWTQPNATHFVHVVEYKNLKNGVSYIDHPALNNYPNASFYHTQSTAGFGNPVSIKPEYDYTLKKWFLFSLDGKPLLNLNRYNIAIINGGAAGGKEAISKSDSPGNVKQNVANDIASKAGGDLNGNYPNPTVIGLQNRPLSSLQPKVGDTLKWDGTQWIPSADQTSSPFANPTSNITEPLKFNGDAGQPGQVLTSNGAGSPPTWKQPPAAGGAIDIQTFMKNVPNGFFVSNPRQKLETDNAPFTLSELTHTITLNKKSRLIISASANIIGPDCPLTCGDAKGTFFLKIGANTILESITDFSTGNGTRTSVVLSNFMIDLNAGTHNIEFLVRKSWQASGFNPFGTYSSIMVIPLE